MIGTGEERLEKRRRQQALAKEKSVFARTFRGVNPGTMTLFRDLCAEHRLSPDSMLYALIMKDRRGRSKCTTSSSSSA